MSTACGIRDAAERSAWDVLAVTHGIRFVVQDRGNGVRRVLSPALLPIGDAKAEAAMPGRAPVNFPPPTWITDLAFTALESMGIPVDRNNRARTPMIYARDIDDYTIELVCWRA